MNDAMHATTMHLRHTDKEGHTHVRAHRVWDRTLFIESTAKAAADAGGKCEVITEAQYQAARK